MSLQVRLRCDGQSCAATTAQCESAPDAATDARRLTWVWAQVADEVLWFCPLHQRFDPRLQRWVGTSGRTRSRRPA